MEEEIKATGKDLKDKLKGLLREGNVRRVVIRNSHGRTLLDMPLTAGVAGVALLPLWAAVATIAALAADLRIAVERDPALPMPDPTPEAPEG